MADELEVEQPAVSSQGEGDTQKLKLKVWKTVKTGIYKSAIEALSSFKEEGGNFHLHIGGHHFKIGGYAADAIKNLSFGSMSEVNLALVSVRQLGFKYRPKYKYVCGAIDKKRRIDFCTAEDLILCRLSHYDTESDKKILIPVGTSVDEDGQKIVFRFASYHNPNINAGYDEYWILRGNGDPDRICELNEVFLVRLVEALPDNSKAILNLLDVLLELKNKREI